MKYEVDMTVEAVRALLEDFPVGDEFDELVLALDTAQGDVHMGREKANFIVIKVTA